MFKDSKFQGNFDVSKEKPIYITSMDALMCGPQNDINLFGEDLFNYDGLTSTIKALIEVNKYSEKYRSHDTDSFLQMDYKFPEIKVSEYNSNDILEFSNKEIFIQFNDLRYGFDIELKTDTVNWWQPFEDAFNICRYDLKGANPISFFNYYGGDGDIYSRDATDDKKTDSFLVRANLFDGHLKIECDHTSICASDKSNNSKINRLQTTDYEPIVWKTTLKDFCVITKEISKIINQLHTSAYPKNPEKPFKYSITGGMSLHIPGLGLIDCVYKPREVGNNNSSNAPATSILSMSALDLIKSRQDYVE